MKPGLTSDYRKTLKPPASQSDSTAPSSRVIFLSGKLSDREGENLLRELNVRISRGGEKITLNLAGLREINSRGGAWLIRAVRRGEQAGVKVVLRGARGKVADFIELTRPSFRVLPERKIPAAGIWERIGKKCFF